MAWANISVLTYLGGLVVSSIINQNNADSGLKGLGLFLGAIKFFLTLTILFFLIAVVKLPAISIFGGALTGLTFMSGGMSFYYIRYLKAQTELNEQIQEGMRLARIKGAPVHA